MSGNETDNRFVHLLTNKAGSFLLVGATDLTNHHDRLGVGIVLEGGQTVDEVGAVDRITSDADTGRLANPRSRHLINDFVGERARATDEPDVSGFADAAGNDADVGFAG